MLTRSKRSLPAETPVDGGGDATGRRSSRLRIVPSINYHETAAEIDEALPGDSLDWLDEGQIDVTTKKNKNQLGSCEVGCNLFINDVGYRTTSLYEKSRLERIQENKERMKNLGILNLKSEIGRYSRIKPVRLLRSDPQATGKLLSPAPARRSSRLQNVATIKYCELRVERDDSSLTDHHPVLLDEGQREEVYTEEHEKMLGSCEMDWNLFVDGYDSNGKRIYDQVKGKTCHQCRQKTLGHHTSCAKCNLVQGQFCGDCLYMRYGENVLEVQKNPTWICPVCRGICNCSLCRVKKGWAPTGSLYRKVQRLGYKSVAHFLILNRRGHPTDKESADPNSPKKPQSSIGAEFSVKTETVALDEEKHNYSIKNMKSDPDFPKKSEAEVTIKTETFSPIEDEAEDCNSIKNMQSDPDFPKKAEAEVTIKTETFSPIEDQAEDGNSIKNMQSDPNFPKKAEAEVLIKPETFSPIEDEVEDCKRIKNMKSENLVDSEFVVKLKTFAAEEEKAEGHFNCKVQPIGIVLALEAR